MKILSIRLKNLASIEGDFNIDFTVDPLASAGIFAISGPTGAGKSTILDALCLALYDKTPRFSASNESLYLHDVGDSQINQSDVKNILRRGTGEGFAEVDFRGVDGHRYQSRWSVRRARGKSTGSLQNQTMQVVDLDTEKELQGTKTEILNQLTILIGLTYEQFTRTVLLAQNDFATFLKSRESAKAELLEKLTGTEIYSQISRSVYVRSKHAMEELNLLKSSMNLIELLPEEELKQLKTEKKELTAQRATAAKQLTYLNDKLKVVMSLKVQQELLDKKRHEAVGATGQLAQAQQLYAGKTEQLTVFRQQCEALQPELRKARELDIQIRTVQANDAQAEQIYTSVRKRKEETARLLTTQEAALSKEMPKLAIKPTDEPAAPTNEAKLEQAGHVLLQYEQQIAARQQENDERLLRLNAFGIQTLGEEHNKLMREQKRLQSGREAASEWIRQCREEEKLTLERSAKTDGVAELERQSVVYNDQLKSKHEQVQTLQRLYDNARIAMSKDVEAIRHSLTSGEACPVCGAKQHPYTEGLDTAGSMYRDIEKEYKAAGEEYQTLNNQSIAIRQNLRHAQEQQTVLTSRLSILRTEIEQKKPAKEEERTLEYFNVRLDALQQLLDELSDKLKAYQQLHGEWQQHDRETKTLRVGMDTLRETIATCRLLLQQVASVREQLAIASVGETDEHARFMKIRDELERLRKERAALLKGKTADDAEAAVQRHEKELVSQLETSRQALDRKTTDLSGLQGEIRQLTTVVGELIREQEQIESPEKLPEAIAVQQAANQETERKLSLAEARLMQQEQNRRKLEEIGKELKEKQIAAEQWEKLNKLIGSADGTKFKVIAQGYTLNLLLLHANKHLSYLSKRYKLQQVPDTLALQVIDCDMCDEVRTVYSLSGGESFLISLALALGLSSLSSHNLKVESLFIDEGFGSLDAESLRTAMEALEQLRMQGRKIGVISHVQEMSERIPVQIQVQKLVNGKSSVEIIS